LQAGWSEIAADESAATLAVCIGLVSPYLIPVRAEGTDKLFRIRVPYLYAAGATFLHRGIVPRSQRPGI
jgi:hypothetical protein